MEFIISYNGKSTILASPIVPALTLMGRDLGYVQTAGKCGPKSDFFCLHVTLICLWHDSVNRTNHMGSFQFRFVPLPYVVLNPLQVRCFTIRPQSEQSYRN